MLKACAFTKPFVKLVERQDSKLMITIEKRLFGLGFEPVDEQYLPLSLDEISRIERSVGRTLPPDYKAFILKFGCAYFPGKIVGARPIASPPPDISQGGLLELAAFLGSGDNGHSVLFTLEILRGRMPETMVPIVNDHSGDVFCLETRESSYGHVYFWSGVYERSRDDYLSQGLAVPDDYLYQNLTYVAESFTDFIMRLEIQQEFPVLPEIPEGE